MTTFLLLIYKLRSRIAEVSCMKDDVLHGNPTYVHLSIYLIRKHVKPFYMNSKSYHKEIGDLPISFHALTTGIHIHIY